ncbi:MbtH family protein [Actinoplanes sp. L3-i22]|uniref:MbtH family protein n=1 Tax=Actinoplanes sp. L3-i22 TaxID=2836373 RepID=UPI001C7747A5|nr:MbtH family protein [Actinoplanes sp. L3-i22]BCY09064.1 MbtH protein [Actinoplanes sp. L3-i22]
MPEHLVVRNDEQQYSVWPAATPVPAGWQATGFRGDREHCLDHIAEIWTDLRPRSVREFHAAPPQ